MKNLYKILALQNEKRKKYLQNPFFYGKKVKRVMQKLLPEAKLFLFGSSVRGEYRPESDLDILIISKRTFKDIFEQVRIKIEILKHFPNNPFEIHLVNQSQFENWYRRFLKKDVVEI